MRISAHLRYLAANKVVRAAIGIWLTLSCLVSAAQGVVVGRVSRIQDGDSVVVQQGERTIVIRLAGIDAPELAQPFGRESRQQLKLCSFGRIVVVETRGVDRHGRVLGTLEADGVDCGLEQLRTGSAWHYRYFADEQSVALRNQYASAERNARQRRIGLWEQPDPTPPWRFRQGNPGFEGRANP
ncbi:MAG: thermonuclease family protein [Ideonella sp.]